MPVSDATQRNQETASKEAGMTADQVLAFTEGHKDAETRSCTRGNGDGKCKALGASSRITLSRHWVQAAMNPQQFATATLSAGKQIATMAQ